MVGVKGRGRGEEDFSVRDKRHGRHLWSRQGFPESEYKLKLDSISSVSTPTRDISTLQNLFRNDLDANQNDYNFIALFS